MSQDNNQIEKLKEKAKLIRKDILAVAYRSKSGHIGSSFSIVEILVALYFGHFSPNPQDLLSEDRDRFILSKGHGCPALYAALLHKGLISEDVFCGFAMDGGALEQHPTRRLEWGIEVSTGSLGHGLSIGAGMALAAGHDKKDYRVFVLMSDGESNEGSIWEAALFGAHQKLDNLVAVVDYNKMQALGKTKDVIGLEPLADKWRSFGWAVKEVDGHDIGQLIQAFEDVPFEQGRPSAVIAHTVKGRGVCFMEDDLLWHYRCPDEDEYKKALGEI
ncbi:MAG: transketolase [Thermodesulfobacteriota bacterium]|nr:transketolase [Thermodesulfobacteriota bacterium]